MIAIILPAPFSKCLDSAKERIREEQTIYRAFYWSGVYAASSANYSSVVLSYTGSRRLHSIICTSITTNPTNIFLMVSNFKYCYVTIMSSSDGIYSERFVPDHFLCFIDEIMMNSY